MSRRVSGWKDKQHYQTVEAKRLKREDAIAAARARFEAEHGPIVSLEDQKIIQGLDKALKPWVERSSGRHYWEGATEEQALTTGDQLHTRLAALKSDQDRYQMIKDVLKLDVPDYRHRPMHSRNEADLFLKHYNGRNRHSKHREYGVPHAAGKEEMWGDLLDLSGKRGRMNNSDEDPSATDLRAVIDGQDKLIDIQNHVHRYGEPTMTIGVLKNMPAGVVQEAYAEFDYEPTLQQLVDRAKQLTLDAGQWYGDDKLMATGYNRQFNRNPDLFQRQYEDRYAMDILAGGVYPYREGINQLGAQGARHGSYDPELPDQLVITNLDKLRSAVLDKTLPELSAQGIGNDTTKEIKLTVPVKELQRIAAVDPNTFLSERVMRLIQQRKGK